jgi:hypothetical protein
MKPLQKPKKSNWLIAVQMTSKIGKTKFSNPFKIGSLYYLMRILEKF